MVIINHAGLVVNNDKNTTEIDIRIHIEFRYQLLFLHRNPGFFFFWWLIIIREKFHRSI